MYALAHLSLSEIVACSAAVRRVGERSDCMEAAATEVVRYLRSHLIDKDTGEPACALVRCYLTLPFERLTDELQAAATAAADDRRIGPGVTCLTLLATAGDLEAWNDRRTSRNHRAIPLGSVRALERLPMVHRLVTQLGLSSQQLVHPEPALFTDLDQRSYNVFHVEDAVESPYVPAQDDFVLPFGVKSVLGFGGVLPSGALVAVILFSRVTVPGETADLFRPMAVSVKLSALPFVNGPIFTGEPPLGHIPLERRHEAMRSEASALQQLLEVSETTTLRQAIRLERALEVSEERAAELDVSRAALVASNARNEAVVSNALDAIITIDDEGSIVEFNPAACAMFGFERDDVIGCPMAELIVPSALRARHYRGFASYLSTGVGPILGNRIEVSAMRADGSEFPIELAVTAVEDQQPRLFTGYIRDVTVRRQSERALLASRAHARHIARTLQDSLLPPSLPAVPGMEVAARYRPAGDGGEVGGDFYDLFQIARDRWMVALGDVCGKGTDAAKLTALVRYTVRAAAVDRRKPTQVLSLLNKAIMEQQPDQFCTVVLADVQLGRGRCRLTVASGGHPFPLLSRRDGEVGEVGGQGGLVGQFASVAFTQQTTDLGPGDAVVFFTDGVTEAKGSSGRFGDDRWSALVGAHRHEAASAMADALLDAVMDFQGGDASDDIAILVLRRLDGDT